MDVGILGGWTRGGGSSRESRRIVVFAQGGMARQ